jgi:hypothetical protein
MGGSDATWVVGGDADDVAGAELGFDLGDGFLWNVVHGGIADALFHGADALAEGGVGLEVAVAFPVDGHLIGGVRNLDSAELSREVLDEAALMEAARVIKEMAEEIKNVCN